MKTSTCRRSCCDIVLLMLGLSYEPLSSPNISVLLRPGLKSINFIKFSALRAAGLLECATFKASPR